LPFALPQLSGVYSGENMGRVVNTSFQQFGITPRTIGYFVLDNATNNDTATLYLSQEVGFNATHRRLCCTPHTINLVEQTLLCGKDADAYDNDPENLQEATKCMRTWRYDGPLSVLIGIITYIKTLQQHDIFNKFERLANNNLCQPGTSFHKVHVNYISHVTLCHLLTHFSCVYNCSM
jgi:hypothetical protein